MFQGFPDSIDIEMQPKTPPNSKTAQVQAFITNHSSCTIQCPRCDRVEELTLGEISSAHSNSFECQCPCGAHFTVRLVGFRAGHRKRVNLAASWARASEPKPIRRLCAVLDLSFRGMRFTTDFAKDLAVGEDINVSLILDDEKRAKLELPAVVKRVSRTQTQFTVAVEFQGASNEHLDMLRRYTAS